MLSILLTVATPYASQQWWLVSMCVQALLSVLHVLHLMLMSVDMCRHVCTSLCVTACLFMSSYRYEIVYTCTSVCVLYMSSYWYEIVYTCTSVCVLYMYVHAYVSIHVDDLIIYTRVWVHVYICTSACVLLLSLSVYICTSACVLSLSLSDDSASCHILMTHVTSERMLWHTTYKWVVS